MPRIVTLPARRVVKRALRWMERSRLTAQDPKREGVGSYSAYVNGKYRCFIGASLKRRDAERFDALHRDHGLDTAFTDLARYGVVASDDVELLQALQERYDEWYHGRTPKQVFRRELLLARKQLRERVPMGVKRATVA